MLTVKAGGAMVSVKAHKDVRRKIGEPAVISVPASICHLFDVSTGNRIQD
jgi:multiple sugar transport system ATP-binding protein